MGSPRHGAAELALADSWRRAIASTFDGLAAERTPGEPDHMLAGTLRSWHVGRAGAYSVQGTSQTVRRTVRAMTQSSASPLKLCLQLSGAATVRQGRSEVHLDPGQLALYDTGRPYDIKLDGTWRCAVVTVPREAINIRSHDHSEILNTALTSTRGQRAELAEWMRLVRGAQTSTADPAALGELGVHLVCGLVGASTAAALHDVTRERARIYIRAHLQDANLNHATVARALDVSVRTLHRLFADETQSVAQTIRTLRLERVRADLEDPRLERRPVMWIAQQWGYVDRSHFCRAYKAQYGVAPSEARRAALQGSSAAG